VGDEPAQDALPDPDAAELAQDAATPSPPTPAPPVATPTPATPEKAPQAAPLPPTAAGGDYAVHFGAFGSERDAQLIVRQLSQAGLTAYSEPFTLNGRPAQRVRLGPFASRESAEAMRVRAAQVRSDVSPRVVALDAAAPSPRPAAAAASTPAQTRAAAANRPATAAPAPAATPAATPAPA